MKKNYPGGGLNILVCNGRLLAAICLTIKFPLLGADSIGWLPFTTNYEEKRDLRRSLHLPVKMPPHPHGNADPGLEVTSV